ncbi:MAG: hypothetical protein QF464_04765 [Myxococcota bacterium]|nr:hypothetical protein [Myxococcota bacterium]
MRHSLLIVAFAAILAALAGCDLEVEIKNATPSVTWVAAQAATDGVIDVTVWVYDLDRDPVDLTVTWSMDGVEQGPIALASGGHGIVGLTTDGTEIGPEGRPDPDGQPHLLRWALPEGVGAGASLALTFTPDDRIAPLGQTRASVDFTRADGLPKATLLTAVGP